jgi:hypothetical protein
MASPDTNPTIDENDGQFSLPDVMAFVRGVIDGSMKLTDFTEVVLFDWCYELSVNTDYIEDEAEQKEIAHAIRLITAYLDVDDGADDDLTQSLTDG